MTWAKVSDLSPAGRWSTLIPSLQATDGGMLRKPSVDFGRVRERAA